MARQIAQRPKDFGWLRKHLRKLKRGAIKMLSSRPRCGELSTINVIYYEATMAMLWYCDWVVRKGLALGQSSSLVTYWKVQAEKSRELDYVLESRCFVIFVEPCSNWNVKYSAVSAARHLLLPEMIEEESRLVRYRSWAAGEIWFARVWSSNVINHLKVFVKRNNFNSVWVRISSEEKRIVDTR